LTRIFTGRNFAAEKAPPRPSPEGREWASKKNRKMNTDKIREEIMLRAEKTLYYSELVIQQCDDWEAPPKPFSERREEKSIREGLLRSFSKKIKCNFINLLFQNLF